MPKAKEDTQQKCIKCGKDEKDCKCDKDANGRLIF